MDEKQAAGGRADVNPPVADIEQYLQVFAREAGHRALQIRADAPTIARKDDRVLNAANIVTAADTQIGAWAEEFFPRLFPAAHVIQEETVESFDPAQLRADSLTFVVDPIDGTLFYAQRSFAWTVSVGCFLGDRPVAGCIYAPAVDDIYYTSAGGSFWNGRRIQAAPPAADQHGAIMLRHIRAYQSIDSFPGYTLSLGSPALHLALVASGFACCCLTSRHRLYDVAGAIPILENAGAELAYLDGATPAWGELLRQPAERSPQPFIACAAGHNAHFRQYVRPNLAP